MIEKMNQEEKLFFLLQIATGVMLVILLILNAFWISKLSKFQLAIQNVINNQAVIVEGEKLILQNVKTHDENMTQFLTQQPPVTPQP